MRSSVNPAPETTTASGPTEENAINASGVPQMLFVDDEGLEEQFLTDEETANALDTPANCVTTPVNTTPINQSILHFSPSARGGVMVADNFTPIK